MLNSLPVSDEESVVSETPARKKKSAPKRTPLNNISSNPYTTEKESWPTLEASDSDSGTDTSDNAYEEDNIADMGDWVDDRSNDDETQFEQSQTYEQPRSGRESPSREREQPRSAREPPSREREQPRSAREPPSREQTGSSRDNLAREQRQSAREQSSREQTGSSQFFNDREQRQSARDQLSREQAGSTRDFIAEHIQSNHRSQDQVANYDNAVASMFGQLSGQTKPVSRNDNFDETEEVAIDHTRNETTNNESFNDNEDIDNVFDPDVFDPDDTQIETPAHIISQHKEIASNSSELIPTPLLIPTPQSTSSNHMFQTSHDNESDSDMENLWKKKKPTKRITRSKK